jgi:acetyl-CoA acetyltransferase family protein
LAEIAPVEMLRQMYGALDDQVPGATDAAEQLTVGCVGQIGPQGGHIALVSKIYAGLPEAMPATTVNNFCVSGLSAIGQSARAASLGDAEVALAGGVESMSQVPFLGDGAAYYTDPELSAKTKFLPVAISADALATREDFSREALDAATLESHRRAAAAEDVSKAQHSRIPVCAADGSIALAHDELVRGNMTAEKVAAMEPAFVELGRTYDPVAVSAIDGLDHVDHHHTIAHAPGVSDGAGMTLVASSKGLARLGAAPRARIVAYAEAGGHPVLSLLAGFSAMEKALARAGLSLSDIDTIEMMEAFAVLPLIFQRNHNPDPAKVNVFGGHLAKGHPMGASGAILTSGLIDTMDAQDTNLGLVVAAGASGIGAAMVLERTG